MAAILTRYTEFHIVNQVVQYQQTLDRTFGALSDPSRRAVLERLGAGHAPISELAELLGITLTGTKKHVQILEAAGLVTTEKVGRTRYCRLGPRRLEDELGWIETYRRQLDERLDRFGELLAQRKGQLT